jgi:hypothetical protein
LFNVMLAFSHLPFWWALGKTSRRLVAAGFFFARPAKVAAREAAVPCDRPEP